MSELRKVKLSQIDPNPFRDIDEYPIDKTKVEILRQSMERTGFWDGYMLVRVKSEFLDRKGNIADNAEYEMAFGHHRVYAAIELWGADHEITVTVADLDDDTMLAMMANENSERFAQYFYLSVMEPIEATVKAYAEGRIDLEKPDPKTKDSATRNAPGYDHRADRGHPYTAATVARYLGWTQKNSKVAGGIGAAERVLTALAALELIERKILSRKQFLKLTSTQAKTLVDVTRARMKAEQAQVDADLSVRLQAMEKAEAEGDTNKVEKLTATIQDITSKADSAVKRAGKAAASQALTELESGKTAREVVEAAKPKKDVIQTKHVKSATQTLYDLIAVWERTCLDTDPKWVASEGASVKAMSAAYEALMRLSERAKNRAEEIK